jgi:hypothetical protein
VAVQNHNSPPRDDSDVYGEHDAIAKKALIKGPEHGSEADHRWP